MRGATGVHHYSLEVQDFNSYLKLGDLLDRADKQVIWGPSRHRPGDNTYAYYVDASGCMIECSGAMALVADDANFVRQFRPEHDEAPAGAITSAELRAVNIVFYPLANWLQRSKHAVLLSTVRGTQKAHAV